jgi:hypothetical protein
MKKQVGSSEVIESVFGKLKRIEGDQEKKRIYRKCIKCMRHGVQNNIRNVKKAMETISTPCLNEWCMKNLGDSIQCQRKKILKPYKKRGVAPN